MMLSSAAASGTQMKFNPVNGNDTMVKNGISKDITTKLMCVTAMQQYQNKSLEELRVEDYQANRKFPTAGSTSFGGSGTSSFGSTGSSMFGSNQQSSGTSSLFGNNAAKQSIFGSTNTQQQSGGLFGSNAANQTSSMFGTPQKTQSIFGSSTTGQSSLFGGGTAATSTGSSLFGAAAKPSLFGSNTSSPFGATSTASTGSLFGNNAAQQQPQSNSLFGSTTNQPQSNSLFGNNAAKPAGSLFGGSTTTQQTTGGLFGNTQAKSMFGNTTASPFGATNQPATSGGSLFGGTTASPFGATNQPATSGGSLFGGTTSSPFGATNQAAATGSMFGNAAQKPATGLFGSITSQPAATGSMFGNTAQKPATGLFGSTATQPATSGGLFGGGLNQQTTGGMFGGGSTFGQQPATQFQQQTLAGQQPVVIGGDSSDAAIRQAIIESQLAMYPYGDSPLLRSFSLKSNEEAVKEAVKQQMEKERQNENYFGSKLGAQTTPTNSEGAGKRYQQSALSAGRPSVFNYKPLVQRNGFASTDLNSSVPESQPAAELSSSSINDSFKVPKSNLFVPALSSLSKKRDNPKHLDLSVLSDAVPDSSRSARLSSTVQSEELHTSSPIITSSRDIAPSRALNFDLMVSPQVSSIQNVNSPTVRVNESFNDSVAQLTTHNISQESAADMTLIHGPAGVTLSKRDIYTEPAFEELENFVKDGKVHLVDGFVVGRLGYGRIEWPGAISFSNVDLGDLVRFQRKQVVVYPDETKKPPVGEGFNRKAIITLENIYPYNKETKEEIRDPLCNEAQTFSRLLERKCLKMDCDFLEYDAESGTWMFRVKHFSRYGFFEDEEDGDTAAQPPKRHKPDSNPLQPIQENVIDEVQELEEDNTSADSIPRHGKTLGFDDSMHDATNFIDPKSLFVSNFDEAKFKRLGIAEDILDFIEPNLQRDTQTKVAHTIRRRVRIISKFTLNDKLFSDPAFKYVVNLHGHPLARRIGFGPSSNTFVTALFDAGKSTNQVLLSKIKLVPTIEAYLINYLKEKKRESDFDQLMQTQLLCTKPPSKFLRLIDAYLFDDLRTKFSLDEIDEKMHRFCEAICQNLDDTRFDVLQRHAFNNWLREELHEELEKKLESLKLSTKVSPYAAVWYCLYYGFVERAVKMAADSGLAQLSLFISLYINGRVSSKISQYAKKMFDSMKQVNSADPFRRRIYNFLFSPVGDESKIHALAVYLTFSAPRESKIPHDFTGSISNMS
ncbi:Peptidase S59 domain-containing protein [Aphelenchoides bicaudatus]|nr:Peptidase S59 domain-containing protein [Aphelenchoides bicaudatus]